ncbi:site-specific integrase [Pyxidicoccus parkwayensis]|uniref:site-specific integrase n=1 Tax=Pyxidicoccus parkwayensis TaxID=2813578 RepID=UPI001F51400F|nr:site-specific integrase [Pyxidicoccus parkwaysis]
MPLKAVQGLMGRHATIEMTLRYAHLSSAVKKKDAMRALNVRPTGTQPGVL